MIGRLLASLFLAFILILPVQAGAQEDTYFRDVLTTDSHYGPIMDLVEQGVITGYSLEDGTKEFRPSQVLRREHAAVIFTRTLGLPAPNNIGLYLKHLKDVNESHLYAKQISAVIAGEIFGGNGDGEFMPSRALSREQMATVLVNAFNLPKKDGNHKKINLSNVDASHAKNVQILADYGITNQLKNFEPKQPVTRGQFATFLKNTIDASKRVGNTQVSIEDRVLELVNKERKSRGLSALQMDEELAFLADLKAKDMRKNGYFDHVSPLYGTPAKMLNSHGVAFFTVGENIAKGYQTPEAVVQGWMDSPGHKANILNETFQYIGVGFQPHGAYWVQVFVGR